MRASARSRITAQPLEKRNPLEKLRQEIGQFAAKLQKCRGESFHVRNFGVYFGMKVLQEKR
jgi:hypothetical protein